MKRLSLPALLDDDDDIRDVLCGVARSFRLGWEQRPPQHSLVTIVARPGRCVFGLNEAVWLTGWRHSNHFESIYTGDLILVTEHGWADLMSQEAGHEPRMVSLPVTS